MKTDTQEAASPENADAFGLARSEVRRRSLAGVFYLTSSSLANLLIGFIASLVLARLLTPTDFGVVAIGSTVMLITGALADGGLGAGMVRRPEPPTRAELRTLNGIQLSLTLAIVVPAVAVALGFGRVGTVTAIMMLALPISVLQSPGRILLARNMKYDRQLAIDFSSQATMQIFSVVAVVLGAGVWGLATAQIVKAVVGTVLTSLLAVRFQAPSLHDWRKFGGLVRFGLSFQASWLTWVAREQAINVIVGVIAGVASLGIWTFTNRIFQFPSIAFASLNTVGFPFMANLLARGEDPGPVILRMTRRAAIAGTFVFPTFAAAGPQLIPSFFGESWQDAADILPFICLSTIILGSIATASTSYLSAAGRPGIVAWASASLGIVWVAVTAPLLPIIGVTAIGVGNLMGAVVEAAILNRATRQTAHVSPYRQLIRPLGVALVAGTAGWLLCNSGPTGLLIALAAGSLTVAISLIGLWLVCRDDLTDAIRLAGGSISGALPQLRRASPEGT